MTLRLYTYWRSSSAYRVRIALNLKGLDYESIPVHLARGEQSGHYADVNPQGLVPALDHDGRIVTQSLAIVDYLDHAFVGPRLIPAEAGARARVSAMAQLVACDIQPLNNLRVLQYLDRELGLDEAARIRWYRHWIAAGFSALERELTGADSGEFCHGNTPTLADACLVPQLYNARRFDCDLDGYPCMLAIEARCLEHDAFVRAAPENQPDAG